MSRRTPTLEAIARDAARRCRAREALIYLVEGALLRPVAQHGPARPALAEIAPVPLDRSSAIGRSVLTRRTVQASGPPGGQRDRGWASAAAGASTILAVPLVRNGVTLGVVVVRRPRRRRFSVQQMARLKSLADEAAMTIENARLSRELEARSRELTAAREREAATGEILRVIASSLLNVQPTFDAIAAAATKLCGARHAAVFLFDGTLIHFVAHDHYTPEEIDGVGRAFPRPPGRGSVTARAILTRAVAHVPDFAADPELDIGSIVQAGVRAGLSVPMLRDGAPIGAITVTRREPVPFADSQVALLETFARQAVIAIENVRLFKELEARNHDLTESLEQQRATSEILKVISSSPTNVQPVFAAVAASAARLCDAFDAAILQVDGDELHVVAHNGAIPAHPVGQGPPLVRGTAPGRAVLDRRTIQIADAQAEVDEYPEGSAVARHFGFRTVLCVPLLRGGEAIGAIAIRRTEVRPFTDQQVELLKTFADQAVIAIENARLFTELQAKNRQITEALEQQTATSEILRVISASPTDLQPVFETIVTNATRLCGGRFGTVNRFDGELIHLAAHYNLTPEAVEMLHRIYPMRPGDDSLPARAILRAQIMHFADIEAEPDAPPRSLTMARILGYRSQIVVPMLREGAPIGALSIARQDVGLFPDTQVELLKTFADQAVIAIENVRLFTELQARNRDLTDALDRQTATAEILRAISQAQTDVQPVFEAIADSAMRLFKAWSVLVHRYEGWLIRLAAARGGLPGSSESFMEQFQEPRRPKEDTPQGRTVLTRAVQHVVDVDADASWGPRLREDARVRGFRSVVSVPMLRGGDVVGVITVSRDLVGGFAPAEIAVLQTFADQAVIAVENARLLTELQARTAELSRSVGQLTALGEVGRAVSSTLDLETVLTTIVSRAVQLAGMDAGAVFEYDEAAAVFHLRATQNLPAEFLDLARPMALRKGEGAVGRLAVTREPVQIPDIAAPGAYQSRLRDVLLRLGHRALLAVPLFREERILGGLIVNRKEPGEFGPEVIDLLRTFATQSALAIQNARLYRELEEKGRQLEAASRHKSEFLASMSHELRTPLNAIIGFSEVLQERMFGELNLKQGEYMEDILASGRHLLSLINDILDLSKIEAGRMELDLTAFDLPAALDNTLTLVRERAARHGIALERAIDPALGEIIADERKVKQILLNLLSNAIKFTPGGGRILVQARPVDGVVEVAVSDTGIGIAPEDQGLIFEEFRQVGGDDARKHEGTGLGLALTRRFVEMHGGRIEVTSQVGQGSTFIVTLPVRP